MLSVITTLEFFQHYFAKMGHRNTSCDPHLHPSHQATKAPLPHAKRPPPGGYVLTPKPDLGIAHTFLIVGKLPSLDVEREDHAVLYRHIGDGWLWQEANAKENSVHSGRGNIDYSVECSLWGAP